MGAIKIDMETRLSNEEWRKIPAEKKPMERRPIFAPGLKTPQGYLHILVDILTEEEARRTPPLKIEPPPKLEYELRVTLSEKRKTIILSI